MEALNRERYRDIALIEEAGSCLLCSPAPCAAACPRGVPADRIIRAVRFENTAGAANRLPDGAPCPSCESKPCLAACPKGRINRPVPVDAIVTGAAACEKVRPGSAGLSIEFCGVHCENPFFLSSSVVASCYEMVSRAFEMGWAGAAFKTIGMFVPDEVSPRFDALRKESVPFVGFKNIEQISERTLAENLACLRQLKKSHPSKVLIASIMGRNQEEWTELARLVTAAGVDIVECNFSCPHMAADGLGSDVGQNPELVAAFTRAVRAGTGLPVLAKMTPNLGNMEPPAIAAIDAGATGIAAINTVKSVMNVNLDTFSSGPDVLGVTSVGGYSGKAVKPIALRFIQAMKSCPELADIPVSGMGGIETWRDAAEFIAMGCENIQITTAVMQYGYRIIDDLVEGMSLYLCSHGYRSVSELVGKALPLIISADDLDRSSICYPKFDRTRCVGCGRCVLSCADGGHQALTHSVKAGGPMLDAYKCVGCHLCVTVCPAQAIAQGVRKKKK
jgi:dihydropyrimidine dehydrogenase (NAD+) subunit PreA